MVTHNKLVLVMMPAHNEEASIGGVIRRIPRSFGQCKVRVLVIDDGSTDRTISEARRAGADYFLSLKARSGLAKAFAAGLQRALDTSAEVIVNIDADGQYDPEQIPLLVKPILTGKADIVLGSRFTGWIEEMPKGKYIGNRLATAVTSYLSGQKISDAQTGFRAFSRLAVMRLNITGSFTYVQEALIQAAHKDLRIMEVPINFRKRRFGESRLISNVFRYAVRAGLTMMRTYRDYQPLRTFLVLGTALFVVGVLIGLRVLTHFIVTGQVSPYIPSAILTAVLVILGFQAIFLGLIADMLGRNRYLLEETLYVLRSQKNKRQAGYI